MGLSVHITDVGHTYTQGGEMEMIQIKMESPDFFSLCFANILHLLHKKVTAEKTKKTRKVCSGIINCKPTGRGGEGGGRQ